MSFCSFQKHIAQEKIGKEHKREKEWKSLKKNYNCNILLCLCNLFEIIWFDFGRFWFSQIQEGSNNQNSWISQFKKMILLFRIRMFFPAANAKGMLLLILTKIKAFIRFSGLICFSWVWFYGISTIVGYSMPNPCLDINSSISNNSV